MQEYQELVFTNGIEQLKPNIIKITPQFIEQLDICEEDIVISGQVDDEIIINTENKSFKMKGVNISTTMLIINENGEIMKQGNNYLEVQKYQPPFHHIYHDIYTRSCHKINDMNSCLPTDYGFTFEELKKQKPISKVQFNILVQSLNLLSFQDRYLYLSLPLKTQIMRKLILHLNESKIAMEMFSFEDVRHQFEYLPLEIFQFLVKELNFNFEEGQPNKYSLTISSICTFIVMELAVAFNQYSFTIFQESMNNLFNIYLPVSVQRPKQIPEVSLYFIKTKTNYTYYDYLQIDPNVPARLKYLGNIKNRWPTEELKNVLRGFPILQKQKVVPLQEFLLKKFRKYGDQYQIRMILPK